MSIRLFSTNGCHLCEQALGYCQALGVSPEVVDIAFDDDLFKAYGWSIPVIQYESNELHWPFDQQQLSQWFTTHGITHHS